MHRFGGQTKAGLPTAFVARRLSAPSPTRGPADCELERAGFVEAVPQHTNRLGQVCRTQVLTGALARPRSREARGRAVFDLHPHRCRTQPSACKHTLGTAVSDMPQ